MQMVRLVLLILSALCFLLAALEVKIPRADLLASGLALLALAMLFGVRV